MLIVLKKFLAKTLRRKHTFTYSTEIYTLYFLYTSVNVFYCRVTSENEEAKELFPNWTVILFRFILAFEYENSPSPPPPLHIQWWQLTHWWQKSTLHYLLSPGARDCNAEQDAKEYFSGQRTKEGVFLFVCFNRNLQRIPAPLLNVHIYLPVSAC